MNTTAHEVHYANYQQQMAWINANDWQFETSVKRHRVRRLMAQALRALADILTPPTELERQTA
jgi:hypothetical protein